MFHKSHKSGRRGPRRGAAAEVRVSLAAAIPQTGDLVAKQSQSSAAPMSIRTRRTYFDCQFGQMHVRTAFSSSGGFDEQVTLFCLHASEGASRSFDRLLPEMARDRSVYAPDLPGFGESDPAPSFGAADAARAVSDLASDLRLRRIDVLGIGFGAAVALELCRSARPRSPVDIGGASPHGAQTRGRATGPDPRLRARCRARTRGYRPGQSYPRLPARVRPGESCEAEQIHQRIGPLLAARSR